MVQVLPCCPYYFRVLSAHVTFGAAAGVRRFNSRPPRPGPGDRAVPPYYLGPAANVGR